MAYRIDPTGSTATEIRRVVDEQLGAAVAALRVTGGPDAEAVHDVRKRIKKVRSLLRLARGDLGPTVVRQANAELRQAATDLAEQREADALVETVDRLLGDHHLDPDDVIALHSARAAFAARADRLRAEGALGRATVLGAARTLDQVRSWVDEVPPRTEGWAALAPGFGRAYRQGREAFVGLPHDPTVEELHEWRKRVKDLWYHQRLLRGLWPAAQRPVLAAAAELAEVLGDDHDLGVLCALLTEATEEAAGGLAADEVTAVLRVARHERHRLQRHARHLGARLYVDDPAAWVARHRGWWASAR